MDAKLENRLISAFNWVWGVGAILLLALFVYHVVGYFQSPEYHYCKDFTDANGTYGIAMCMSETTVWDSIVRSGWWSPLTFEFRLMDEWFNWTFGIFGFSWDPNNILTMPLGLFALPFWGYWIWLGFNCFRGIGCI